MSFNVHACRRWGLNNSQTSLILTSLEEDIFQYAKKNLAVVNIYIKEPVVTQIMRDQKIPIIAFVANTGGLLGSLTKKIILHPFHIKRQMNIIFGQHSDFLHIAI